MMYNKIYRNMGFLCALSVFLCMTVILLACYTVFNIKVRSELSSHASEIAAMIEEYPSPSALLKKLTEENNNTTYTLISKDGNINFCSNDKFENNVDFSTMPEIISAKNEATGFEHRYSSALSEYCFYSASMLDDGSILHISRPYFSTHALLHGMIIFILLAGGLIFLLSLHIAAKLTDNIVKPITDLLHSGSMELYDEILPLTRAIEFQNEEIKRQTENAQARKVQLQFITDNMNEGLVLLDESGSIVSINNFALKVFNAEELSVKQKRFTSLLDNQGFVCAVEKALQCSRSNTLLELGESVYRVYCSPVLNKNVSSGVIILLFDITSTYQSEKLRREFSANVSHELKTPLTSINGYAQIIASGIAANDDIPEFGAKIAKESNRLMMLIEDIIRLSNLDESAPSEPATSISVKNVVLDTISSLKEKADERNISLHCDGTDFSVTANATQLNELIYNICDNAIKYNKDGGSVTVTMAENILSVADTGIGIPREYTERIFERFFRVDKSHSKKVDGTGLGLSIVKHIAKQNNIEIDVKSVLGEGSVFTLHFHM